MILFPGAPSPSGKARVCKTLIGGSIPPGASKFPEKFVVRLQLRLNNAFAFCNGVDFVHGGNLDCLLSAARPENLDVLDFVGCAKAKMQTLVGTGRVAASAEDIGALANAARSNKHFCADRITRTLWPSDQLERHPVIRIVDHVAQ